MSEAKRIRTLIVDDEPLARARLRALLEEGSRLDIIGEAASGSSAVRAVRELRPDLMFLDIQMPGKDGFDVLQELGAESPAVIFVTAHDEHAIRAFEVEALDYVLKPVIAERLEAAVRRATARLRDGSSAEMSRTVTKLLERLRHGDDDRSIVVRHDGSMRFVRVSEVDWVESDGDDVKVHAGRALHTMRATMAELEAKLGHGFLRVHRSAIVNTRRIREIQPWFKGDYVIILQDGTKVRSGRSYRDAVQALVR